jgi:uncharacterized protein YaaN involved in tellurite resistance
LAAVDRLGQREIAATAAIATAFADRPIRALEHELGDDRALARHGRALRRVAEDLVPNDGGGRRDGTDIVAASAAAEHRIRVLVAELDATRQALDVDNGRLNQQERALWTEIQAIREYAAVAAAIDEALEDRIAEIAGENAGRARALRDDVQYVVRRRRRDILLQLAVATQGYAALRRIEQGNLELIWMLRSMSTTTASALRTAAFAARLVSARPAAAADALADVGHAWGDVLSAVERVESRRREALEELRERR